MTHAPLKSLLLVTFCVFFLTLAACNKAIQRGDELAAQGQWYGAYESYQVALAQDPEDADLSALTEQTRAKALAQTIDQGDQALDRSEWVEANQSLERVIVLTQATSDEQADGFIDRFIAVQSDTLKALLGAASPEDLSEAFALLRLSTPHLLRENEQARTDALAAARDLLQREEDAGHFAQAMALSSTWAAAADSLAQGSLQEEDTARYERWRRALRARATEVQAQGDPARTWMMRRALVSLGQVAGDRQAFEQLDAELKRAASLPIKVGALSSLIPKELVTHVDGVVEASSGQKALLQVAVDLSQESCAESKQERGVSERYVSGTRLVPNPERAQMAQNLGDLQAQESQLHMSVAQHQDDAYALEGQVARYAQDTAPWASRQVQIAANRQTRAERDLDRLTHQYNQLASQRADDDRARQTKNQALERANFSRNQARNELNDARHQLREMETQQRRIQQEWQQSADAQNQATQRLRQAQSDLAFVQGERRRARTLYESEPLEISVEEWSDYPYIIDTWTRRCQRTYTLHYTRDDTTKPLTNTVHVDTSDEAHQAHPTIKKLANALDYPLPATLQSQRVLDTLRQDLATAHSAVIAGWVGSYIQGAQPTAEGRAKMLGLIRFYPVKFAQAYEKLVQDMVREEPLLEGVELK